MCMYSVSKTFKKGEGPKALKAWKIVRITDMKQAIIGCAKYVRTPVMPKNIRIDKWVSAGAPKILRTTAYKGEDQYLSGFHCIRSLSGCKMFLRSFCDYGGACEGVIIVPVMLEDIVAFGKEDARMRFSINGARLVNAVIARKIFISSMAVQKYAKLLLNIY